jgi:hypothetical protein
MKPENKLLPEVRRLTNERDALRKKYDEIVASNTKLRLELDEALRKLAAVNP